MEQPNLELLQKYAEFTKTKVLTTHADLSPKDRPHSEMLAWCREQKGIVILASHAILTSEPNSRAVQNAKVIMRQKNIKPGPIHPAIPSLIRMLLENAEEANPLHGLQGALTVSAQQQRLRMLVKEAMDAEASDIHIEIREDVVRIRFRKHGELYLHAEWLPKLGREVASVAFNKETDQSSTHFNPFVPQNASMPLTIDDQEVRLRLASLPAHGGFDVVMRILTTAEETLNLIQLGYLPKQIEMIKKAVSMPHGAIILSGPTGSGKTTTLAACMQQLDPNRKLYMIEDPVEKIIMNATQVPVNTEHYDRSFASMARTALRMDPDVIVLGEMRDEDTAAVMVRAAITGHLVFSTLHSNGAPEIITRLVDLGISRALLASPNMLVCLICQRLAPKLCDHCSQPLLGSEKHRPHLKRWKEMLGQDLSSVRVRGSHCAKCNGLGISGRSVVAELVWVDEGSRNFIQNGDATGFQRYLKENGWQPYEHHLLHLVMQGLCDPLDAEKLVGEINPLLRVEQFNYNEFNQQVNAEAASHVSIV